MSRRARGGTNRPAPSTSRPDGNRWMIPALALLVVLPIGAAVWTAIGGGDSTSEIDRLRRDRTGSTSLGRPAAPLLPEEVPETYSIVYRVTDTASDEPSITNEEVHVRRPFDARLTVRDGPVGGRGSIRNQRVSVLTKLASAGSDGRWTVFDIPPALATSDVRFGPALDQALADGDIAAREQRRIGGLVCQVFRAGSSLQAGLLTPYEPGASTFADVCIDNRGLVLEEVWTIDGKRVQRKLAIDVKAGVPLDDDRFAIPNDAQTVTPQEGGGSARRVDPTSRPPGPFWELPAEHVPDGFELRDRWAVVSPRLEIMRDPTRTGEPGSTTSLVDVYVRGADVILVERGSTTGEGRLPEAIVSKPVDLGALGQGQAITDFRMNEVRSTSGRDFVRVHGTVPIPILVEAARALTVVEGGDLVFLEG